MCVKIKLSTGVCINYPQGCGQKSFRNFEEFLSCEIQENRLFKIFEKSLTNISACGCSSICSINLRVSSVFSMTVEFTIPQYSILQSNPSLVRNCAYYFGQNKAPSEEGASVSVCPCILSQASPLLIALVAYRCCQAQAGYA